MIHGATASTYVVLENGAYQVVVHNEFGCVDTSAAYKVENINNINNQFGANHIRIYPNPSNKAICIDAPIKVNIKIMSVEGKLMKEVYGLNAISIEELPDGLYILHIENEQHGLLKTDKLVKKK